jgi:cobalt/nickel transport system permease protein
VHIAEGFLPLTHCIAWSAVSAPFAVHGFRRVSAELRADPRRRLMLAASGAFLFTLTALKLPSVAGSSSHPTGVGLSALRCGAPVTTALAVIVLLFQALLLAHGGLTTLGANLFSLGVAGPWAFLLVLRLLRRPSDWAIGVATLIASLATYSVTALQLSLAFPDTNGGVRASFLRFGSVFLVSQSPVAVAEALFTVLVTRALKEGDRDGEER